MITFFLPQKGFVGQRIFSLLILFFPVERVIQRNQVILSEPSCISEKTETESKTVPNKPLTCVMQKINTCGTGERKVSKVQQWDQAQNTDTEQK